MTILDYFVLIVVIISVFAGGIRGIIKGVLSIVSVIAGLVIAAQVYPISAYVFGPFTASSRAANLLGFVTVFLLVIVAGALLARFFRGGVKRARLGWLDHLLGAAFGLLRGWLICSVVYLALTAFPVKLEAVQRASFAPALLEGTRAISYLTSPELRERFVEGYTAIKQVWAPGSITQNK